ncbi:MULTISPECIES: class I SAM-dependent methyltransferase [Cyanophyceae]|uniref:class I SAM-dependent methyltransferase n=1 Tax=Cyanophyceae TaxID=3028117 RepID=UPI0016876502|nr:MULTISPECIES: class I SAM-dependent methyltransferase [Cyanophyceae]MBD1918531.1 class I SAM-dependent methyltransferase [Phormidium sp. FACHB-77]MBD2031420.1 class I SAM-dependent methyltransferase [Phormidium sp. FACHB-322]MBD2049539.1 class I SAM-dependent methyltransferase [Leptolyngbya sp. FACHB-60]
MTGQRCPLCHGGQGQEIHRDRPELRHHRAYYRCDRCNLIFVRPDSFLPFQAEKAEYDLHQNHAQDLGYRRFLSRLGDPLLDCLAPSSQGLDFGSGPGPTLSVMLEAAGHSVALYDPFYADDRTVFARQYDFITATEVIEHLRQPRMELDRLWSCLKSGGTLGLMTKLSRDDAAFARWHYKSDRTHICFFSVQTFNWLAARWRAKLTILGQDVILLRKQ